MSIFISEFIGTFFMLLFGVGVVANVLLTHTKGQNSGWFLINIGWAMSVFIGISVSTSSGSHLNPAVTLAMLMKGNITADTLIPYLSGQLLGCMAGAVLAYLLYRPHYDATEDNGLKLATFSTGPAIPSTFDNLISEIVGTFALIGVILFLPKMQTDLGHLNALPVALLVLGIGVSLGGPTGYGINPARDLGPRIVHALLPMKSKGDSNWSYAWIPVVGPCIGAILAVLLHNLVTQ